MGNARLRCRGNPDGQAVVDRFFHGLSRVRVPGRDFAWDQYRIRDGAGAAAFTAGRERGFEGRRTRFGRGPSRQVPVGLPGSHGDDAGSGFAGGRGVDDPQFPVGLHTAARDQSGAHPDHAARSSRRQVPQGRGPDGLRSPTDGTDTRAAGCGDGRHRVFPPHRRQFRRGLSDRGLACRSQKGPHQPDAGGRRIF